MNKKQIEILTNGGVDLPDVMRRMVGNEKVLNTCLQEFLEDTNLEELNRAADIKDTEKAFTSAHTLKGTSGNMGFTVLMKKICVVVELLRTGNINGIAQPLEDVNNCYAELTDAIRMYFAESGK